MSARAAYTPRPSLATLLRWLLISMKICKKCLVSGRVQGVFYRASAAGEARRLGVTGYAKNLADGRVEVLACGEEGAVKELIDWLWAGPPNAKVQSVETSDAASERMPGTFETR